VCSRILLKIEVKITIYNFYSNASPPNVLLQSPLVLIFGIKKANPVVIKDKTIKITKNTLQRSS